MKNIKKIDLEVKKIDNVCNNDNYLNFLKLI